MQLAEGLLKDMIKRFKMYKDLGDRTFAQLSDEDVVYQPNEQSNSIAMIVQHLHGNMLSRFTNFLTEDGEKPSRNRDKEFDEVSLTKADVINLWNEGWACFFNAVEALQPDDLMKTIYIRSEPLLVYDALLRQLAHYPNHIGQIQYIGKMRKGAAWQSLSIPKGQSELFNTNMAQQQNK
jgi:hypothetical protein